MASLKLQKGETITYEEEIYNCPRVNLNGDDPYTHGRLQRMTLTNKRLCFGASEIDLEDIVDITVQDWERSVRDSSTLSLFSGRKTVVVGKKIVVETFEKTVSLYFSKEDSYKMTCVHGAIISAAASA